MRRGREERKEDPSEDSPNPRPRRRFRRASEVDFPPLQDLVEQQEEDVNAAVLPSIDEDGKYPGWEEDLVSAWDAEPEDWDLDPPDGEDLIYLRKYIEIKV